jgi:lactoylglutathione lyase
MAPLARSKYDMKFGYAIIYVPDVEATISFYEKAFGLKRRMVVETGEYGELETGETALAFAADFLAEKNLPDGYRKNSPGDLPPGFEAALVTEDVAAAFEKAVAAGAVEISKPEKKPWGQVVAYVRDLNGVPVEICSPM